jgi:ribonuclease T2
LLGARAAFAAVAKPPLPPRAAAEEIAAAFLEANPALAPDGLIVTCRDGLLREVRICLDRGLAPRRCAADVRRAGCRGGGALDLPAPP